MIDLTYLTEMEQEMILSVLKRDANLKKSEEQRVKNLQKQVHDKSKLKYLTGEWFYETKSRRHRDRIHGSDIIRASISGKKPVTILELSQMWSERPSFVNSENQDVYVPPELSGLLEETPEKSKHYYREDGDNLPKESQDMLKRVLPSSSKQRQNPFNSTQLSSATLDETEGQLTNGGIDPTKTPDRGHEEDLSLIRVEKKQMTSRPLSRSMEDILSPPKREDNKTDQEGAIIKTVNDVSAVPPSSSLSVPEQMKMISKSVSSLQYEKDGRDSDSTSVNSLIFGWKKRTGSSLTNLSVSSGMASMSSVSSSVASIYSGLERDVDVKGTIQFAINYVQKLGEFQIFVVHCRDLAVAEPKKNRSDPYVKCYLLPDKAKMGKRKTSVKKKTLNPTYNEILRFKVTMETLKTQNLNVSVWHNDNFGRNSFLGKVDLDLSEWDFSNTQMNDYTLKERVRLHKTVVQSTKTETGEVQIWVKDCKNLPAVRDMVIDPFVKCTVLPETSRKSRQKTRVVKKTVNPMFNHTMVYGGFLPDDLRDACVEVTVWDHDRTTNHFLGGLRLGLGTGKCYESVTDWMDSTAEEAGLWERMMQSHNEWVEDILPLRMLIMGKGLSK
uniref:Synaptotagmin-like 2a n=1 Tax=Esox lucius TaxID=8010 RepID=A0A3P9AHJ1_ESOLU